MIIAQSCAAEQAHLRSHSALCTSAVLHDFGSSHFLSNGILVTRVPSSSVFFVSGKTMGRRGCSTCGLVRGHSSRPHTVSWSSQPKGWVKAQGKSLRCLRCLGPRGRWRQASTGDLPQSSRTKLEVALKKAQAQAVVPPVVHRAVPDPTTEVQRLQHQFAQARAQLLQHGCTSMSACSTA